MKREWVILTTLIAVVAVYAMYTRRSQFAGITKNEKGEEIDESVKRIVEQKGLTQADVDSIMKFIK